MYPASEFIPLLFGLFAAQLSFLLRSFVRKNVSVVVLSVLFGFAATFINGEDWKFIPVDVSLTAVSAFLFLKVINLFLQQHH